MNHLSRRSAVLFILAIFLVGFIQAQSVGTVQANLVGSTIEVSYSVSGLSNGQKFDVQLFSSHNDYTEPLTEFVSGDIGEDVILRSSNTIVLEKPLETLEFATSDIQFRVKIELVYFPVTVKEPTAPFNAKKGKKVNVLWTGGISDENVKFDLYRNGNLLIDDLMTTQNFRMADVRIPKKQAKGEGYHLEMQFDSIEEPIKLPDFTVKSKKGWIALVVIGVVGYSAYSIATKTGPVAEVATSLGFIDPPDLPATPPGNPDQQGFVFKFN